MKKKFTQFIQIAIMLFVFQMLMPNLTAQPIPIGNGPIGSNLNIDNNGVLKYWNGIAWITIAPGLPGQNLQFTNGNPTWINNPQGILTTVVSSITLSTAISGGTVLCDGGALINARGICWSTSHNPTILDNHTSDSIGLGIFTSNITGLLMGTTYYVRAYATNSVGTAYGNEVSFYVLIKDFDGNVYDAVTIGTQTWMKQNLKVTHYRNGDAIPNVTDGNAWGNLSDGAYCNYNNDNNYANIYGRLYNWFTVVDSRNLCPTGWHMSTSAEWTSLANYLGGSNIAGTKLKETGLNHWNSPNTGATNETGFTALPGGWNYGGGYNMIGNLGIWWSNTQNIVWNSVANSIYMNYNDSTISVNVDDKKQGFSARCVKDYPIITPSLNIGQTYQGGKIAYLLQPNDNGYDPYVLHGLIVAPTDQSTGSPFSLYPYNGMSLNGYNDWYLPSKEELYELYLNRLAIGGFSNNYYWSSTGTTNFHLFVAANLSNWDLQSLNDQTYCYIRVVRKF